MTGSAGPSVDDVFCDALELPADERDAFVASLCAGDVDLEREVRSLLDAHRRSGAFLSRPIVDEATVRTLSSVDDHLIGTILGSYEILERIGSGGMGTLYLASRADATFEKRVAIKVIKRGMDTDEILQRFRNERQVLADLEHPNIARLLDGGATPDGLPYLVMEYVEGERIDEYCDARRLTVDDRLDLFIDLCEAVQYAHRNLVVHRDLKPGNVLVTSDGQVRLLDFGIAKVLDGAPSRDVTATNERPLTPAYASPEELRGGHATTASDVYALGVILYELLAGRHPFRRGDEAAREVERRVCEEPPTAPSTTLDLPTSGPIQADTERICTARSTDPARLRRQLRGDLENIILMALRKQPERRYASVEQLLGDIHAYRAGRPVLARADSLGYRASRFIRRNRKSVAASVIVLLLLVGGLTSSLVLYSHSETARRRENIARLQAEQTSTFLRSLLKSINPSIARSQDTSLIRDILDEAAARIDTDLAEWPSVAQSIHLTIGQAYNAIAEYQAAEKHLRQAMAIGETASEQSPAIYTEAVGALGSLLFNTGQYDDAIACLDEALMRNRAHPESGAISSASILHVKGQVYQATGEYDKSIDTFRESIAILRESGAGADAVLANVLTSYASTLADREMHDEAFKAITDSLAIHQSLYDDNHPELASAHLVMGWVLRRRGEFQESEKHYRTALAIAKRVYPENHPEVAIIMNQLAGVLEAQRNFDGVEQMYRESLAIYQSRYGESHREVGTAHNNLAVFYRGRERFDEAESHFRKALASYEASLGPDHVFVAIVGMNFIAMLESRERLDEAGPLLDHVNTLTQKYWEPGNFRYEYMRGAMVVREFRRVPDTSDMNLNAVEEILLSSHKAIATARPPDDILTQLAVQRLVDFYRHVGRPKDAATYQQHLDHAVGE